MAGKKGTLTVRIVGDAKGFKGALDEVTDVLPDWAKKTGLALAGAGLLAGGLFASQLMGAVNREKLNDKLAAQLRLDPDDAKRIAKVASDVYAGAWGESIEEVNLAIRSIGTELADLTDVSDAELTDLTTMALDVASAFDMDVTEAVRTAGIMMRNGLADDATHAFDIITTGFQSGADASGDLLDSFNEYSEPLSSLGISGARAIGIINSGLDDGIWNADRLLDGIKEFSIRVLDESPAVEQAFKDMNLEADGLRRQIIEGGPAATEATNTIIAGLAAITDPLARERAGVALFGTVWEDVGGDVLLKALDPILAKTLEVEGATKAMGDTLNDNVATKIEEFKRRSGEAFQTWASEHVLPAAQSVIDAFEKDGVGGAIERAAELWAESWPEIERWLTDVVGPAIVDIGARIGQAFGEALAEHARGAISSGLKNVLVGALESIPGMSGAGEALGAALDIGAGALGTANDAAGGGALTGTTNVTVIMPPHSDGQDVVNKLREEERRNGPIPVTVGGGPAAGRPIE